MKKRRYGLVGTGMRARLYTDAITGPHRDVAELVALCDTNEGRMRHYGDRVAAAGGGDPARYHPDDLARLIGEEGVERIVVTSPDHTHADIVVGALEAGADVIVEKPLAIDADGARAIARAAERTGRRVTVTHNYRYSPRNSALKRLVHSGAIGTPTSAHFEWVLDTRHGADYFRRWHREKDRSGGLLVHKASHHFDLVNWWLGDTPVRVYASGGLFFYGADNARDRGLGHRPARGSAEAAAGDPWCLDLRGDPALKSLYLDQEHRDGYLRDRDVFDGGISIEDNLCAVVDYAGGPTLAYSLNAHAPWEGYRVCVNGTEGRAELSVVERGAVRPVSGAVDPSAVDERGGGAVAVRPPGERLVVQRHWEDAREVTIPRGEGAHGGGDIRMLREIFVGPDGADPLRHQAGYADGLRSVAVGIAGNVSLAERRAVDIAELRLGIEAGPNVGVGPSADRSS
ncbi:Gfo/Idh/MocA family oxidoreductase [Streptomyces sp. NPDC005970]|uniref:Gfo/Idh/MocA family protein n=1 Tax=Streptomyces sp. NPDC005970 TaxID=3156723 RepID=UPI0033ECD51A